MKPRTPPPDLDLSDPDDVEMVMEIVAEELMLQDYEATIALLLRIIDAPTKH